MNRLALAAPGHLVLRLEVLSAKCVPSLSLQSTPCRTLHSFSMPGHIALSTGLNILTSVYSHVEKVKLCQQQCRDMSGRCVNLLVALQSASTGLEGSKALEVADEVEIVMSRIDRQVKEWASWSFPKSVVLQGQIKDGIDKLQRDIDAAMMKFQVSMGMELARGQMASQAIQRGTSEEILQVLQTIMKRIDDRSLLNVQSSQVAEDKMESVQTDILGLSLESSQGWLATEGFPLAADFMTEEKLLETPGIPNLSDDSRPIPKRPSIFSLPSLPLRSDSESSIRSSSFRKPLEMLIIPGNEISEADKLSSISPSTPSASHFGSQTTFSSFSSPSTVRSAISTDSGIYMPEVVSEAVTDPRSIVKLSAVGNVISGTLEGLVGRLTNNFNSMRDLGFHDTLLLACADFTTPETLFGILARRFHEAEGGVKNRVAVQYDILTVITYWVSRCHLPVNQQLLSRMKNFCEAAIIAKTSPTMAKKASELLQMIDERSSKDLIISPTLSPGRKLLQDSDIAPHHLAIALTLLEGDKYKAIVPSDYIAHLRKHPGSNSVKVACLVNNKIVLWVKQSVLHYDTAKLRAQRLEFFLNTAQECRKLRNYESLIAIGIALHSAPVEHLKLTKQSVSISMRRELKELGHVLDPSSNHRGYHKVLDQVVDQEMRNYCVPWLAVHLKELRSVLTHNPIVVEDEGRPLINFQRYVKFMDKIKETLHHKPPDLEQYRQQGYLAYLENQLQFVHIGEDTDDELMKRSIALRKGEVLEIKRRYQSVGFNVRP